MRGNLTTAETPNGAAQEARVFAFLLKPKLCEVADFIRGTQESVRIPSDQAARATAIAQLKLFNGKKQIPPSKHHP